MAFQVEDGTGKADANSYASVADADTYATDRANAAWLAADNADKQAALIRATASLDASYGQRFTGWRVKGRGQALAWPRYEAYDHEDELIPSNSVPPEIVRATIELAFRELTTPGSTSPDLERGGQIKRVKAGSVEVEYADSASAETTYTIVQGILGTLLSSPSSSLVGYAVRR
jgi:hypothetical protein